MENNQTEKPPKNFFAKEKINITLEDHSTKRKRKAVYLDEETAKLLEIVKTISSYNKTQDTVIIKRALEYVLYNKQDLKETFEKVATLTDIEKNNKKHIGKLNSDFEIFQSENFQHHQFMKQFVKQLSQATQIEDFKKRQEKFNTHFFNQFKEISEQLKELLEKSKPMF